MSQIKFDLQNTKTGVACGVASGLFSFLCMNFLLGFPILTSVPIYIAFILFGNTSGVISTVLSSGIILGMIPFRVAGDILINSILPSAIIGYYFTKSMKIKNKIWWYPESLIIRNFVLYSFAAVAILSYSVFSESYMQQVVQQTLDVFVRTDNFLQQAALEKKFLDIIPFTVGFEVMIKMLVTVFNLRIALWTLRNTSIKRKQFIMKNLNVPSWMALAPLVALTLSYLLPSLSFVLKGLSVIGFFGVGLVGNSIVHDIAEAKQLKGVLIAYWISLLILFTPTLLLIILLGTIDSLYPLRKKLSEMV